MAQTAKKQVQSTWHWDGPSRHLRIDAAQDHPLFDLAGNWSLASFDHILEGLSKGLLARAFASGDGPVQLGLRLSDGRKVSLVGGYERSGIANGFLLIGDNYADIEPIELDPGPELAPVFQPIFSLQTGRVAGFEALARWDNVADHELARRLHTRGLANNMLIRSAEALHIFRAQSRRHDLFMHVNLTARDLATGSLPALIEALMNGYDLKPQSLRMELTEQAALRDAHNALSAAKELKAVGAGLVLDDFGTGHSSFEWLADLPADSLKIDPGLTQRIGQPRTDTILQTITLLAERLGMTTTAEGVERRENAALLRTLGFDHVQGFAFAKPMDTESVIGFLKTNG